MAGKRQEPPEPGPEERSRTPRSRQSPRSPTPRSPRGGRQSEPKSSASADPLDVERDTFTPPASGEPELGSAELEDYEPAPPELIEWTPERAGALVRGFGFVLHSADGLGHEEGGAELWRATGEDADAIGPPLARILNRYAPARRLAGVSDEAELAFAVVPYMKRNLQLRGRLARARAEREATLGPEWGPDAMTPPAEQEPPAS